MSHPFFFSLFTPFLLGRSFLVGTYYGRYHCFSTSRYPTLQLPCHTLSPHLSHVAFTLGTPLRDPLPFWPNESNQYSYVAYVTHAHAHA